MAGRKTRYKKSYADIAREACAMGGFSYAKLGRLFKVSKTTVWDWRQKYPEFDEACRGGYADYAVEEARNSLTKLVKGFSYTEVTQEAVTNKQTKQTVMMETKRVRKQVQPNINAVKLILERYDIEKQQQETSGELSDLIAELDGTTRTLAPAECELLPESDGVGA